MSSPTSCFFITRLEAERRRKLTMDPLQTLLTEMNGVISALDAQGLKSETKPAKEFLKVTTQSLNVFTESAKYYLDQLKLIALAIPDTPSLPPLVNTSSPVSHGMSGRQSSSSNTNVSRGSSEESSTLGVSNIGSLSLENSFGVESPVVSTDQAALPIEASKNLAIPSSTPAQTSQRQQAKSGGIASSL
uniref:Mediator complex subunit 11 n=1 Tax=Ditylenchus dipsaci TaxID=166011 RepID=A0A915DTI5_9BILA